MDGDIYTYNDIYDAIREYHWMIVELERLKGQFGDLENDPCRVLPESNRRKRKWERMKAFERRIVFIDKQTCITKEQEKVILDNLLDGVKIEDIAANLQIHRKTVGRIRDRIILQLFESQE